MNSRHFRITGKVQGVWFRASMQAEGDRLGLSGWVRNRSDGSVEAVMKGEKDALDAITAWTYRGPDLAQVDEVQIRGATEAESSEAKSPVIKRESL